MAIDGIHLIETLQVRQFPTEGALAVTAICVLIMLFAGLNLYMARKAVGIKDKTENIVWIVIAIFSLALVWTFHSKTETRYKVEIEDNAVYKVMEESFEVIATEGETYIIKEK